MAKKAKPQPYVHQEYPDTLFLDGASCIVQDPDQRAAKLDAGWGTSPHHKKGDPHPEPPVEEDPTPPSEPPAAPPAEKASQKGPPPDRVKQKG